MLHRLEKEDGEVRACWGSAYCGSNEPLGLKQVEERLRAGKCVFVHEKP